MRHYSPLLAFLICLLLGSGGFILYQAIGEPSRDQLTSLMGGAFLLALGLSCLFFEGRSLVRWMQHSRLNETRNK
jgi:hypothetical protein